MLPLNRPRTTARPRNTLTKDPLRSDRPVHQATTFLFKVRDGLEYAGLPSDGVLHGLAVGPLLIASRWWSSNPRQVSCSETIAPRRGLELMGKVSTAAVGEREWGGFRCFHGAVVHEWLLPDGTFT